MKLPDTIFVKLSKQLLCWAFRQVMIRMRSIVIVFFVAPHSVKETVEKLIEADLAILI